MGSEFRLGEVPCMIEEVRFLFVNVRGGKSKIEGEVREFFVM